jgi:hypothetical protein
VKLCTRCQQWLPRDAFTRNVAKKDGLQGYCRDCQRAYVRAHYAANIQYYLDKANRSRPLQKARLRTLLDKLKDAPCTDCGQSYPPCAMDFDHVRGDKMFNLGEGLKKGKNQLLVEAAKCELVCANCHRQRTHSRRLSVEDAPMTERSVLTRRANASYA